jgi:hypothetical protein
MLLVLGVRHLHAVVASGRFHCPSCGGDRPHRLLRPRAWFHLFWVPLVPLRRGAPFVECGACRGRFLPATLAVPTAELLGELLSRALRTAAGHLLAAAPLVPGDLRRAQAVLQRSQGPGYTREMLVADLAVHREASDLAVLEELSGHLQALGKERLLRGLADLVLALGHPCDAHWRRLADVAARLAVTPAHLRAIVADATAGALE